MPVYLTGSGRRRKAEELNQDAEMNKDYYEVYVGNNNSDIMTYLQEGRRPMNGPRRGFGISEQSIKRIGRQLNEAVKIVKRGQRA